MYGSTRWQVQEIFHKSGINQIGMSRHAAKREARQRLETAGRPVTRHVLAKMMGIHSYATADAYRDAWRLLGQFVRENFKLKDMEKLTGEHVQAWLSAKQVDGVAHATFMQYAAAVEKLETALNMLAEGSGSGRTYTFEDAIATVRTEAHQTLARFDASRAYADPDRLVNKVQGPEHHLAAAIQRESGCRVHEANRIRFDQLRGLQKDPRTGQVRGWVEVKGKGGKVREIGMSPPTYARLKTALATGRGFEFDPKAYRRSLAAAAKASGQRYEGSHGLRWSWAQERFAELQDRGGTREQALVWTSREMGHERGDITEHYLR